MNQKTYLHLLVITLIMSLLLTQIHQAKAAASSITAAQDQALCLPGSAELVTDGCLLAGPAARLHQLAAAGLTIPVPQVYASATPRQLGEVIYTYGLVSNEEVPLYATLDDIVNENPTRNLRVSKIKYVTMRNPTETVKGLFYQIATDEWISADKVRRAAVPNFQGYVFKRNPDHAFGWILDETIGRSAPDFLAPQDGKRHYRFEKVIAYESKVVNDIEWVMVGPDEWIEHRYIARVLPSYNRPAGVTSDKWIEINLYEQVLTAYENGSLVFATLISSGVYPFYTKPGVFQVYKKFEYDPMSGAFEVDKSDYYYLEEVPYIMYYDDARAIHGAYWQSRLGYENSHGCVNLSVADAHWIFNWANVNDYVYVHDPSGKTPTDPEFYKGGGY